MKHYKALLTPGSIGAYMYVSGGSLAVCATLMNLSTMLQMEAVIQFFFLSLFHVQYMNFIARQVIFVHVNCMCGKHIIYRFYQYPL